MQYKCYESLRSHLRFSGCCGEILRCAHCSYKTMKKPNLRFHIHHRHGSDPDNIKNLNYFICPRCNSRFIVHKELLNHLKKCGKSLCNFCYVNKKSFCKHLYSKTSQNRRRRRKLNFLASHTCPTCNKIYKYKSAFLSHISHCVATPVSKTAIAVQFDNQEPQND